MAYSIRVATPADAPHIIAQREQMFRDMGIAADFTNMAAATERWLATALPDGTYRAWLAVTGRGEIAGGGGLVVIPWPPGPMTMDPRCAVVFNVYTAPEHRRQGVGRRLMEGIHAWCRGEGIERVVLNASVFGQPLYEDLGYVVTSEPMMRLRIPPRA
jgi:GNAT superfamily N-acetyltransferase